MKFTKALLASALAAQVSAQCSIKSGQIAVIGPLADAWKLYNKQVAVNAEIDDKIAAAQSASAAEAEAIEAHHAGQATAAEGVHAGVVADIGTAHGTTVAGIGAKLTETQNSIEAKYQAALTAAQEKHDTRQANADANIANLQARGTAAGTTSDEAKAAASTDAAAKREAAQAKADVVKADIAAEAAAGVTFTDARDVAARAKINAKHAASVLSLAQRYVEIHDKIQGTKFDVAATLAVLDDAGQEGGTPYANDCFVQVSDAIGMVKAEMTPGEIWEQVVINGNAQARQAVTDEPTNAPTDAPTYRDLTSLEQCLVDNGVRTHAQAAQFGEDGARNTFIAYESNNSGWTVSALQNLDDDALLGLCNDGSATPRTYNNVGNNKQCYNDGNVNPFIPNAGIVGTWAECTTYCDNLPGCNGFERVDGGTPNGGASLQCHFVTGCDTVAAWSGGSSYVAQYNFITQPTQLVRNTLHGTIKNGVKYDISFDLTVNGPSIISEFSNILHLTTGANHGAHFSRMPALWLYPGTSDLYVISGNYDGANASPCVGNIHHAIGATHHYSMRQSADNYFRLIRDGVTVCKKYVNRYASSTGVKVFASDPWYPAANAVIDNLVYSYIPDSLLHD